MRIRRTEARVRTAEGLLFNSRAISSTVVADPANSRRLIVFAGPRSAASHLLLFAFIPNSTSRLIVSFPFRPLAIVISNLSAFSRIADFDRFIWAAMSSVFKPDFAKSRRR